MEEEQIDSIRNWPRPQCVCDVQVFIRFANFYHQFIKGFSKIAKPLTAMLKFTSFKMTKSDKFFTPEAVKAFNLLKEFFVTAPVFCHFDMKQQIQVETDASEHTIGGIFSQQNNERHWNPVAFYSRKMIFTEHNYEMYNAELLAIVEVFKHWRHYLKGSFYKIFILTDHNNLWKFIDTKHLGGRQIYWAQKLSCYNFWIDYHQESHNPTNAFSKPAQYDADDKELIIKNTRILYCLQEFLLSNNPIAI